MSNKKLDVPTLVTFLPAVGLQLVGVEVICVHVVGRVAGQLDRTKPDIKKYVRIKGLQSADLFNVFDLLFFLNKQLQITMLK